MAKKKHFHCQKCNSPCEIYKKGKKHRVLVCPQCGVLATNPISFKGLASAAASSIPIVGGLASYAVDNIGGKSPKSSNLPTASPIHSHLTAFEKALLLEKLEHTR
jgi:hypothetical protein